MVASEDRALIFCTTPHNAAGVSAVQTGIYSSADVRESCTQMWPRGPLMSRIAAGLRSAALCTIFIQPPTTPVHWQDERAFQGLAIGSRWCQHGAEAGMLCAR